MNYYIKIFKTFFINIKILKFKEYNHAGRLQLIKSVVFGISSFWLNVFPLPKKILKHIESICRSFLWSGKETIGKKAPVAWAKICKPKNAGGLNVINLEIWKTANSLKLLWNLMKKAHKLWVQWIHAYYFKNTDPWNFQVSQKCSWILRAVLKSREDVYKLSTWDNLRNDEKFPIGLVYKELNAGYPNVIWRTIFFNNIASPRAKFISWMLLHGALNTRDRLKRIGINTDQSCSFCSEDETSNHLFFDCVSPREYGDKFCFGYKLHIIQNHGTGK